MEYRNQFCERFSLTAGVLALSFHSLGTLLFAATPLGRPGPNEINLVELITIIGAVGAIILLVLFLFGIMSRISRFGFLLSGSTSFFAMLAFLVLVEGAPTDIRAIFAFYLLSGAVSGWSWHILHGGDSGRRGY